MENEETPLWERQHGESGVAYAAFCEYRNLDPSNRSCRQVAEKLKKSTTLMYRWSMNFQWVSRTLAYDAEEDRKFRAEIQTKRRKAAVRQIQASVLAQSKVAEFLLNVKGDELTPQEAARWYEVAVKIERQALGVPDRVEVTNIDGGRDIENMSPEEIMERLAEVQAEISRTLGDAHVKPD